MRVCRASLSPKSKVTIVAELMEGGGGIAMVRVHLIISAQMDLLTQMQDNGINDSPAYSCNRQHWIVIRDVHGD